MQLPISGDGGPSSGGGSLKWCGVPQVVRGSLKWHGGPSSAAGDPSSGMGVAYVAGGGGSLKW